MGDFIPSPMFRSAWRLSSLGAGRSNALWAPLQRRTLFVPPPVSCDVRVPSCAEPLMSKETFSRHYYDTYLPLFKELNQMLEGSEHQNEKSLLKIMRNTIDSPGESDLFQVASNIHNHNLFFENLENRLRVDYDQMSDYAKEQIQTNFTNLDQLKHEVCVTNTRPFHFIFFLTAYHYLSSFAMWIRCMEVVGCGWWTAKVY